MARRKTARPDGCLLQTCPLSGRVDMLEREIVAFRALVQAMELRSKQAQDVLLDIQGNMQRVLRKLGIVPLEHHLAPKNGGGL